MSTSSSAAPFPFIDVTELPTVSISQPVSSGDPHVDALRTAAWDAGFDAGRSEGRAVGHADGFAAGMTEGRTTGHTEGLVDGRADAEAAAVRRVAGALDRLDAAAGAANQRDAIALEDIEGSVVELAVALAAAIVEREVRSVDGTTLESLRRALRLAPERGGLVVRLHPDDVAAIDDLAALAPGRSIEIVADPSVGRGGCLIENDATQVDARIETALARARAVLLGGAEDPSGSDLA